MAAVSPPSIARNPFDILPANLFNLFSTQGYGNLSRHYMAILLRIYTLAEFNRFGLTREIIIAEIVDYLEAEGAQELVAAAIGDENCMGQREAGDSSSGAALTGQSTPQDYASYLLRRLVETGWVEREQHADYTEYVILPDYAFTLLEALLGIQEQKPREYTGQLYTVHQLLTHEGEGFSPALALTQAYENVRQVVRGLRMGAKWPSYCVCNTTITLPRLAQRITRSRLPITSRATGVTL